MAKKGRTTTATKKTIIHRLKTYNFFLILAIVLGMLAGVLMVKAFYQGESKISAQPMVTLGMLEYDLSSGKAVKRDAPILTSLRTFLDEAAAKDCNAIHSFMEPAQYTVISATDDMKQVLLGYGCGDVSAHMFAVYDNDAWRMISPTNHFDAMYGMPECDYVKTNSISKQIAPVCFVENDARIAYRVR